MGGARRHPERGTRRRADGAGGRGAGQRRNRSGEAPRIRAVHQQRAITKLYRAPFGEEAQPDGRTTDEGGKPSGQGD
jgi:hypothetical protein